MIDTVVFDLDGTLLDTLDDLRDAVNYCMKKYHFPEHTTEDVRCFVGNGIKMLIRRAMPEEALPQLFDAVYTDFCEYYRENSNCKTKMYPGIGDLLSELKLRNIKLAIVSNKNDAVVKDLNEMYFSEWISVAVGATENRRKKPQRDSVDYALQCLGSIPGSTLYVGDSEVDIQTALNAGCKMAIVGWGFRTEEELKKAGAAEVIYNWREILQKVDNEVQ